MPVVFISDASQRLLQRMADAFQRGELGVGVRGGHDPSWSPDVQETRVTGTAAVSGRYPAKIVLYDALTNTKTDLGDCFAINLNGSILGAGYYKGRRWGEFNGLPVFTADIFSGGTITGPVTFSDTVIFNDFATFNEDTTFNEDVTINNTLILSITPVTINAHTHNYPPPPTPKWAIDFTGGYDFTGIDSTGVVEGTTYELINTGSSTGTVEHNSASSSTGNKLFTATGADFTLGPNQSALAQYVDSLDGGNGGWLVTPGSGTDELVKVSDTDTTTDYLENQLSAGVGISIAKQNAGANEYLLVTNTLPFVRNYVRRAVMQRGA